MFLPNSLIFNVILFSAFIIITSLKVPLDFQRRVVNKRPIARVEDGENADRLEYAYVVALEQFPGDYVPILNFTRYRMCTGSLINEQFVISAAHCNAFSHRIRYGDLTAPSWSERAAHSNITRRFIHIDFESHGGSHKIGTLPKDIRAFIKNDIALYKVEPVRLTKYAALSAVDYKTLTGLPLNYIGCGSSYFVHMNETEINKRIVEDETRERQIGSAVVKPCGKFSSTVHIEPLICLAPKCNSNQLPRNGDSGGPLLYDGKIVGVFLGYPPTDGVYQPAYTPVSLYLDWIMFVVNSEN